MKKNIKEIIILAIIVLLFTSIPIVNATGNNNPMLKDIKISGYSMNPEFDMFTTEYIVTVDENVEKLDIVVIPDDINAKVEITGNQELKMGRNEIEIKVVAEDGQAKQSYFIYVTKGNAENTNANLKELSILDCELAPSFQKDVINYALEYPEELQRLEINAIPEDDEAKVEIIGNENLTQVSQFIEIKVTAKDNQTIKTYYLTAKKADIPVESPEGNEPETAQNDEQEIEQKVYKDNNIIFYISVVAIIFLIVIICVIIGRRKSKNEK